MKALTVSFKLYIKQIYSDSMLILIQIAPLLAGIVFKFVIPPVANYFGVLAVIKPYFLLFDCMYAMLLPYMLCFASAMIILSELDDSIALYLFVTPLGKKGYIISRLILPSCAGFLCNILLIPVFSLTGIYGLEILPVSFLSAGNAVIAALFTVSFAGNRVEGMALAKLSTILLLGSFVPFFLDGAISAVFIFLPSYWFARFLLSHSLFTVLAYLVSLFVWIRVLYYFFSKKLEQ